MRALVLVGATGIGKSGLSIDIAESFFPETFEIISADSVQVYRYLNIGTGKLTFEEMKGVPHHMIDVVDPDYHFEVNEFIERSLVCVDSICDRGKIPFFVGGSGLYISSFFDGLSRIPEIDPGIRSCIIEEIEKTSPSVMHSRLFEIDPVSAERINKNDRQRIIRALEVWKGTGKPISSFRNRKKGFRSEDTCFIGIDSSREHIYSRINNRVDKMMQSGLVKEVSEILEMGYSPEHKSLKSIGYSEIIRFLKKEISRDDAVDLVKKNSRKYAKKQLTWFKRLDYINWFDSADVNGIREKIKNFLGY